MKIKTYKELNQLVKKRDHLVAKNNSIAAQNPAFAARLSAVRSQPQYVRGNVALAEVRQKAALNGVGSTEVIIGLVAGIVGIAVVIAGSLIYWQIRQEEREFAAENPIQSAITAGGNAAFWIAVVGAAAVGGLFYWDYRKGKPVYAQAPVREVVQRVSARAPERAPLRTPIFRGPTSASSPTRSRHESPRSYKDLYTW